MFSISRNLKYLLCRERNMAQSIFPPSLFWVPPTYHWAVLWSYRWTSFYCAANNRISRLEITQPDISQPKLWQGGEGKVLWACAVCFMSSQFFCQYFKQAAFNSWTGNTNPSLPKCWRVSSLPRLLLARIFKVALNFAVQGRHLSQGSYF